MGKTWSETMKKHLIRTVSVLAATAVALLLSCAAVFADSVIEINNIDDLYNVRNNMSGNYKLMCDIDMTDAVAEGGQYNYQGTGWEPLGATTQTEFTGTFDGNGHIISGFRTASNSKNGLFWVNAGTIKNLAIKGTINGSQVNGFVAGANGGRIINCSVEGTIENHYSLTSGMICGENTGLILKCHSDGVINYHSAEAGQWGGICGLANNSATISECYNNTHLNAQSEYHLEGTAGGIAGRTDATVTIENCYNTGTIEGGYYEAYYSYNSYFCNPYGIAGGNASINSCYNAGNNIWASYSIERSKVYLTNYDAGHGVAPNSATQINCYHLDGLNETQMTMQQSFQGFDFINVWIIDPGAEYKYPQLRNCRQDLGREIDMIELKSAPDKITYKTGDEFDPTGCVVTVLYKDNGSEDINVTADMLSGYDMSTPGIQTVKFDYRGYSLTFRINVNQRPEITGMELTSQPLKTTFIRGTEFDFTGAIAQIRYKDNTTEDFPIDAKDCTGGDINTSGDYVITYTKFGHSVTFNVSVVPVREEGIHIETLPDKVSYIEGEEIDPTGLEVYVDYNSGASAPIEDYTIADYDNSAGVQTITVQYKTFEATFEVSFAEKKILSIEVTKQPDKTEYVYGQRFDPTGMIVTANLDNGKTEEVTDYVVGPMEDRNGMQDLTVSYAGKTTYVTVLVTQRALESVSVTTKPYKLIYIEGSEFDPEGMVVTAKYNDGSTEPITDYATTKLGKTPGNKTIVISYNGKTTTLAVTVIAKTLVSLTVTAPNKVNYVKGESFDPTGMVVTALYNDGTTAEITDYRVAGFGETEEVNILEISYGGKAESIVVTIHDPDEWKLVTKPTCTEPGQKARKCKECGEVIESQAIEATGHSYGNWIVDKSATCTADGTRVKTCTECGNKLTEAIKAEGHKWNKEYTIDKEPTYTEEGRKSIHCSVCDEVDESTVTVIPKLTAKEDDPAENPDDPSTPSTPDNPSTPATPDDSSTPMTPDDPTTPTEPDKSTDDENKMGADGTALGAGASSAAADKAVTEMKNDNDPAGSQFGVLQLKSTKQTKTSVKLTWKKSGQVAQYVVYGNACGAKNRMQKLGAVSSSSYNVTKAGGKKVKKGTYYKFIIVALDQNDTVVSTSKVIHVATKGGKVGNPKSVKTKAKKNKVTLKKGKSFKLAAKAVPASKKLKVKKHRAVSYESSNSDIANVSKKGVIKARSKGTCYVFAYAQNGVCARIKVTVK